MPDTHFSLYSLDRRRAIASDPSTSAHMLHVLAEDHDVQIRCLIACHPNTRDATWYRLARAPHAPDVLATIAQNPHAPPGLLAALAQAPLRWVRWAAAGNPSLPLRALQGLSQDDDPMVCALARGALARRPRLSPPCPERGSEAEPMSSSFFLWDSNPELYQEHGEKLSGLILRQKTAKNPFIPAHRFFVAGEGVSAVTTLNVDAPHGEDSSSALEGCEK